MSTTAGSTVLGLVWPIGDRSSTAVPSAHKEAIRLFEKPQFRIETDRDRTQLRPVQDRAARAGIRHDARATPCAAFCCARSRASPISRVQIEGVWHEFSTINNVREDVIEIVLNLKRIRLKRVHRVQRRGPRSPLCARRRPPASAS